MRNFPFTSSVFLLGNFNFVEESTLPKDKRIALQNILCAIAERATVRRLGCRAASAILRKLKAIFTKPFAFIKPKPLTLARRCTCSLPIKLRTSSKQNFFFLPFRHANPHYLHCDGEEPPL